MPNESYLDSSVTWRIKSGTLDLFEGGYRSTADAILVSGLATRVVSLISAGKEADVYLGEYDGAPIAIKVYRLYRTSHRGGRPIKLDSMGYLAAREYEMTRQAWKGGANVPTPARRVENMFSMRYLGDDDGPAPRLQDVQLEHPELFMRELIEGVERLAAAGVVHSDLSPFNVLVFQGEPWFIDLSEAIRVDRTGDIPWIRLERASKALRHGVGSFQSHFARYGLEFDSETLVRRILRSVDRFNVLQLQ